MGIVGTPGTHWWNRHGSPAGPFFYVNPSFTDPEDFPDYFVVTFSTSDAWVTMDWHMLRSIDGGNSWAEEDAANAPSGLNGWKAGFGDGTWPEGCAVVSDGTTLYIFIAEYDGLVGYYATSNYNLRLYQFNMNTRTWSSLVTSLPEKMSNETQPSSDAPYFCCARRSNGDIVVCYSRPDAVTARERCWLQVWDGSSWLGSPISIGEGSPGPTANLHPEQMIVGDNDQVFIAGYLDGHSGVSDYVWIVSFSSSNVVDDTQLYVSDLLVPYTFAPFGGGAIGTPAYNATTKEVCFPVQHNLNSGIESLGVYVTFRAITCTSAATPTWNIGEKVMSIQEMIDSSAGLACYDWGDGYRTNGGCFYDIDGTLVIVWGTYWSKIGYSRRQSDGTWSDPAYLAQYIPTHEYSVFPHTQAFSVAVLPQGTAVALIYAYDIFATVADWIAITELSLPPDATSGASAPTPVGVSF